MVVGVVGGVVVGVVISVLLGSRVVEAGFVVGVGVVV